MPANTTPVLLKTRLQAVFRLQGVFSPRMSAEKRNCGVTAAKINLRFIDRLTADSGAKCPWVCRITICAVFLNFRKVIDSSENIRRLQDGL